MVRRLRRRRRRETTTYTIRFKKLSISWKNVAVLTTMISSSLFLGFLFGYYEKIELGNCKVIAVSPSQTE